MDLLHDILALPGSASLGINNNRNNNDRHGDETQSRKSTRRDSTHPSILTPLRSLLRPSIDALRNVYRNENPASTQKSEDDRRQVLQLRLNQAESHAEWLAAATELDSLEGSDAWKCEQASDEYDVALVTTRLKELEETRLSGDQSRILLLVRTALTRNLGGMGDRRLYKHCRVGTKVLIDRYIEAVLDTLNTLLDVSKSPQSKIDQQTVLQELLLTRQSFGRSALLLSGGGTFGMNHIDVLKALYEQSLLPRIISGASAGSIVCAVLCSKTDAEIPQLLEDFCYGDLDVFEREDNQTGILGKAFRFLTKGSLFDISNLTIVMRDLLGDMTFQESYNRTRRILNICVSTESLFEQPRLLNYITAPNVMIWSAVAASCSVPFIYTAASLLAKDPRTGEQKPWSQSPQRWIDGSVDNDIPMTRLAEMFNVNHFIVSQVNPHVVPFLEKNDVEMAAEVQRSDAVFRGGPGWIQSITTLAKDEAMHRLHVLQEMGVLPHVISKVRSIVGQRYSGDITILPKISLANFPRVLSNPTTDFMIDAMLSGERATWPKLSEIRNHCAIELALDDAVHEMISTVAFSPSQADLRRLESFGTKSGGGSRKPKHDLRRSSHEALPSSLPPSVVSYRRGSHPAKQARIISQAAKPRRPKVSIPDSGFETFPSGSTTDADNDSDITWDESDVDPSDDEMNVSPSSPPPKSLWPSTKQLFSSMSQPTTPSSASKAFSTSPINSGLMMTRATPAEVPRPSSPELRYKQLFHSQAIGTLPTSPVADHANRRELMRLDISGTKGMMRRRRRTLSVGRFER